MYPSINNAYPSLIGVTPLNAVCAFISPPTNVRNTSATLNGNVCPADTSTSVKFLFGTTSGVYSDSINASPNILSGGTETPVSANINGLTASTTYYYRISCTTATSYYVSDETSFTTTMAFNTSNAGNHSTLMELMIMSRCRPFYGTTIFPTAPLLL